uniref:WD repeat domain 27 n=1 Tax=Cynoglossus semilaevis TaxID=244447 RepID=A0A3P8V4B4_CYNSE
MCLQGSMFSTQAPDSYNLFLTSAVTDGVKLWDLRTLRCVRRYQNHINRCHPCSSAISPCGRYMASGSEDGCMESCFTVKPQPPLRQTLASAAGKTMTHPQIFVTFSMFLKGTFFFQVLNGPVCCPLTSCAPDRRQFTHGQFDGAYFANKHKTKQLHESYDFSSRHKHSQHFQVVFIFSTDF